MHLQIGGHGPSLSHTHLREEGEDTREIPMEWEMTRGVLETSPNLPLVDFQALQVLMMRSGTNSRCLGSQSLLTILEGVLLAVTCESPSPSISCCYLLDFNEHAV